MAMAQANRTTDLRTCFKFLFETWFLQYCSNELGLTLETKIFSTSQDIFCVVTFGANMILKLGSGGRGGQVVEPSWDQKSHHPFIARIWWTVAIVHRHVAGDGRKQFYDAIKIYWLLWLRHTASRVTLRARHAGLNLTDWTIYSSCCTTLSQR